MTKRFQKMAKCPKCGTELALEDAFCQWVRNHPQLSSKSGVGVADIDLFMHRFVQNNDRAFDCICLVEVKTRSAEVSASQRETLNIIGQFVRNRRSTPTKRKFRQVPFGPNVVYATMRDKNVPVKAYGYHRLRMDGNTPDDSSEIRWDDHFIDVNILLKLLRLELDPDTLEPVDFRIRHKSKSLELFPAA